MAHISQRPAVRRLSLLVLVTVGLSGGVGAAAARSDTLTPHMHSIWSVVHILGIVTSLLLVYYALVARSRFSGGVFGEASTYVAVGGVMFAIAFLVMELDHGLNVDLLAGVPDMQLRMGITMFLFTGTVFAFGWAYFQLASTLKDWYS